MGPGSPERLNKFTIAKVPWGPAHALAWATSESLAEHSSTGPGGVPGEGQEPVKNFYFFERLSLSVVLAGLNLTV